jgi:hypothetical protein
MKNTDGMGAAFMEDFSFLNKPRDQVLAPPKAPSPQPVAPQAVVADKVVNYGSVMVLPTHPLPEPKGIEELKRELDQAIGMFRNPSTHGPLIKSVPLMNDLWNTPRTGLQVRRFK